MSDIPLKEYILQILEAHEKQTDLKFMAVNKELLLNQQQAGNRLVMWTILINVMSIITNIIIKFVG